MVLDAMLAEITLNASKRGSPQREAIRTEMESLDLVVRAHLVTHCHMPQLARRFLAEQRHSNFGRNHLVIEQFYIAASQTLACTA